MIDLSKNIISRKKNINVDFFYQHVKDRFKVRLHSSTIGFDREIVDHNLHRPGLALAGFVELFTSKRIQIFGNTEMEYLKILSPEGRYKALDNIFRCDIPCLIVTNGTEPPAEMSELAEKYKIAIFISEYNTTKSVYLISDFLDDQFAPTLSLHGSFVDVYGVGMVFMGNSGIGKSEVALDLVERGHRLVADDVVIFTKKGEGILIGSGTDTVQHLMEIRGIGFIDVRGMFGIRAIRFQKRLEIIIELEVWDDSTHYTRTGLDETFLNIMDVDIQYVKLPIVPGKNITVIAEVIALNYLLKHYGHDAIKILQERMSHKMKTQKTGIDRVIDYFEHDFE